MDGDSLIGTIITGVVVALISALAGYYFHVRQEKQIYEDRREQEKERKARQAELIQHQIKALEELHSRAHSLQDAFSSWVSQALGEKGSDEKGMVEQFPEMLRQGREDLWERIMSVRHYYEQQEPYLEPQTVETFSNFLLELESHWAIPSPSRV